MGIPPCIFSPFMLWRITLKMIYGLPLWATDSTKIMLLDTAKKSMKGPVKIFCGQSKIHVRL